MLMNAWKVVIGVLKAVKTLMGHTYATAVVAIYLMMMGTYAMV